jgi:hypothetical protein
MSPIQRIILVATREGCMVLCAEVASDAVALATDVVTTVVCVRPMLSLVG